MSRYAPRGSVSSRRRHVFSTNNLYDTASYDYATYAAGGTPPVVGGEEGWTERLDLPFNVPPRSVFQASPYKIYPHWFAVSDHRIRALVTNAEWGNRVAPTADRHAPDHFDLHFLPDVPPFATSVPRDPVKDPYLTAGKYWRNRQKRYPDSLTPVAVRDRRREARDAYNYYISGMLVETSSNSPTTPMECFDAVAAEFPAGDFHLLLNPDFSTAGSLDTNTPQQTATLLQAFWGHSAQLKLNGRMQVVCFYPENMTVQHWVDVHTLMNNAGKPVDFTFCYVGPPTGALPLYGAGSYAEKYASVAVRHGTWGDRDPTLVLSNTNRNAGAAYANDTQVGLTPGRSLGDVAPGDERSKSRRYMENRTFGTLLAGLTRMLNGNGLGHSVKFDGSDPVGNTNPARHDWHQFITWSDSSEGSEFMPSRNSGNNLLILSLYHMIPLMATDNVFPTIKRDCVFLHHRVQFTSGMTYTSPDNTGTWTRVGNTANANVIGIIVWAKSPCIVKLTVNGVATTKAFDTGMHVWGDYTGVDATDPMPPLQAGAAGHIKVEMTRNGVVVQETGPRGLQDVSVTSPWSVTHKRYGPDYAQRGGNSLEGWPMVDFDIPDQSFVEVT